MTPLQLFANLQRVLLVWIAACALFFFAGCSPQVGDECLTSQECDPGAICDTSAPGGYCTVTPCQANECPEESVCVEFESKETFCMLRCSSNGDCRDGYTCRSDRGPTKFCYVDS